MSQSKRDSSYRHTKIEKTGDHTFRQHTADGGYFECESQQKLSNLKTVSHVKEDNLFHGIGEKKALVCDKCKKQAVKLQGRFDSKFQKILFVCPNCKQKTKNKT